LRGLRITAVPIAQTAVAASLAWLVATGLVGHARPFFAPVSAIVVVGLGPGRRGPRALELILGVALGIFVADLLVHVIGTGTLQLALVVVLAMTTAVLLGGGPLLVGQATTSAVLVATLQPPSGGIFNGQRAVDALVGGAVGLIVHTLLVPTKPIESARRAAAPVIAELAGTLEDVAVALRGRDHAAGTRALLRARSVEDHQGALRDALDLARETARLMPPGRAARGPLALYVTAEPQLELAVRNVRVLARGVLRAIELREHVPDEVSIAIEELAVAVRCLGAELGGTEDEPARAAAIRAAGRATHALEQTGNLSVSVIVGQVRSAAVDLLRGSGMERDEALRVVRQAAAVQEMHDPVQG
jgi:uncharacterized membrane protein YccC